ncbi:MAG: S1/P1 nuclease [Chthoniobacterales bacterium]|nr:S1/P1 nuclease [Chthoniobacterales bacterium]
MMKYSKAILPLVLIVLFHASPARAWDSLGHMIIAQIAGDQLTPEARVAIDQAMARFNEAKKGEFTSDDTAYDFVTASCWMDDIRALRDQYDFGKWHYINLPFNPDGLPTPDGEIEPNVVWGVQRCTDIISGKAEDPSIDKDQALVMLLHLVGDTHQPLHTTNRNNDAGGNRVELKGVELTKEEELFSKKKEANLHAFWDSSYRRTFRDGKARVLYDAPIYDQEKPVTGHAAAQELIRREADVIKTKYPSSVVTEEKDVAGWVQESHEAGYDLSYGKLPDQSKTGDSARVDQSYVTASSGLGQQRVAMAGYRLGALLNRLYAPAAP